MLFAGVMPFEDDQEFCASTVTGIIRFQSEHASPLEAMVWHSMGVFCRTLWPFCC